MKRTLFIIDQVARNLLVGLPPVARRRSRHVKTSPVEAGVDRAYLEVHAFEPFRLLEGSLGDEGLEGKHICEIGPGDHLATALLALGAGARSYLAFDRFASDVGGPRARRVYAALYASLDAFRPGLRQRLDDRGIDVSDFPGSAREAVRCVDLPIERAAPPRRAELDVLFSNNVVEHLADVGQFARIAFDLLRPGGVAVHRIDLGPHDVWRERGNPFEWLIPSERIWRWMGSNRGTPNRLRHHEIRSLMLGAGFEIEDRVTERYDPSEVVAARASLARRFRDAPLESLSAKTVVMLCRKPR